MQERFEFSPLKPILLVIAAPGLYFLISRDINKFISNHEWSGAILILVYALFIWPYLRITFLMLTLRPAVILTDESITITATNYSIDWKDVQDVFMADSGESAVSAPQSYYVTISVWEPEKYLKAIKNPVIRWYRWVTRNWRSTGAFEVDLSLVRGDKDEIYHTILKYYQNNRGF